jgi:hypothetical protein
VQKDAIIILIIILDFGYFHSEGIDSIPGFNFQAIKLLPPDNDEIHVGTFPDFDGDEEQVAKKRVNEFEDLLQKMKHVDFTTES